MASVKIVSQDSIHRMEHVRIAPVPVKPAIQTNHASAATLAIFLRVILLAQFVEQDASAATQVNSA